MKDKGTAYLFWIAGLIGIAGLHRIYLGKVKTGILWFLTLGLFGIGTIIDAFTLGSKVEEYNASLKKT